MAKVRQLIHVVQAFPYLALRRLLVWTAMRAADWRLVKEVPIGVVVPTGMNEEYCYERIEEALWLIDSAVPYRFQRMRKDIRGILCFGTGRDSALGAYVPLFRVCIVDPRYVLDKRVTTDDIARTILHEATHARLHQSGIRRANLGGHRIEAVCVRAEEDYTRKRSASRPSQ